MNGWRTSIGRNDRKGPEILLDAWYKGGFIDRKDVQLYMKVNMVYETKRDYLADIKKHLGYDIANTNIIFDTKDYPEEELRDIYCNADVFVSPTKGEGWGICVKPDTYIHTKRGLVQIKDIIPKDDWVITEDGKYNQVLDKCSREIDEEIYAITPTKLCITTYVTKEHPILTKTNAGLKWVKATKLKKGDIIAYPKFSESEQDNDYTEDMMKWFGFYLATCSVRLGKFLKRMLGDNCYNKNMPFNFLTLPKNKQAKLIEGLWKGDGNENPNCLEYTTTSVTLANQVKLILMRNGFVPSIYRKKRKFNYTWGIKYHESWKLSIAGEQLSNFANWINWKLTKTKPVKRIIKYHQEDGNYIYVKIAKIIKERYNGSVYDIQVKGTHSFLGETICLHNTITEAMACGIMPIVPNNRYSGHMDFCNKNNSMFIDIDRVEEVDSRLMGHLYSGSKWHIPSTDHLIAQMRWCVDHPRLVKAKGKRASKDVMKNWTWDHASDRLVKELKRRGMYK